MSQAAAAAAAARERQTGLNIGPSHRIASNGMEWNGVECSGGEEMRGEETQSSGTRLGRKRNRLMTAASIQCANKALKKSLYQRRPIKRNPSDEKWPQKGDAADADAAANETQPK
ncbi:GL19889 [Drosophila persimilis]|uniref:GL19889 n=1 Tax=Drosophila persimilis TaxID=7234 RepID=B4GYB6_DROPE|nr:GL19889 [Drosophila persimilis]